MPRLWRIPREEAAANAIGKFPRYHDC